MDSSLRTPIPADGLLLHIGVHKTGTTALQEALRRAKPALAGQGIFAEGAWGRQSLLKLHRRDHADWRELRASVTAHPGRAVVSHESLCEADDAAAAKIVRQLAPERPVTVLITVRSLAALLPSTWQQLLKKGLAQDYAAWLHDVFARENDPAVRYWARNNYVALVQRWGGLVDTANVIVAVSQKEYPTRNLDLVESLVAAQPGTIVLDPGARMNRSMSFPEAELMRAINAAVVDRLSYADYREFIRHGAFPGIRDTPTPPDPIPVPRWAAEAAARNAAGQIEALRRLPIGVVGDLERLGDHEWHQEEDPVAPSGISVDTAAAAVAGVVLLADGKPDPSGRPVGATVAKVRHRLRALRS